MVGCLAHVCHVMYTRLLSYTREGTCDAVCACNRSVWRHVMHAKSHVMHVMLMHVMLMHHMACVI